MLKLSPNVYTKLSHKILEERLHTTGKRIILSDIDGTLHKGILPGKYNLTYIDIALHLLLKLPPKQSVSFFLVLGNIFFTELIKRNEDMLIEQYGAGLLGCSEELIKDVCSKVVNIDSHALLFLKKIAHDQRSLYLVTKSLEPLVDAYRDCLAEKIGIPVSGCSNSFQVSDGKITGLEKKVVTAEQKAAYVTNILAQEKPEQVIAFGDSKEDALFFSLPYPEHSLRIAVNPKDEEIKNAADVWSWSWKELYDICYGNPPSPQGKKKWFMMGVAGVGALVYAQDPPYYTAVGKETGKMCSDWVTARPAKKENMLLVDLHVHVNATTSAQEMVEKTPRDVNVICLADKSRSDTSFFDLREKLEREKVSYKDKGYLLEISGKEKPLYIAYAQETAHNGFHILSIGHRTSFLHTKNPLKHAKEENGIIVIAHPYTVENKTVPWLMPYWFYPENAPLPEHDALEAFNAQNMFFMAASNARARRACDREKVPGVAGSDTHGIIEDIGISGNYFSNDALDFSSDKAFYSSLRKAITENRFERREHYASPITFLRTIALGHIQWYHYGLALMTGSLGLVIWGRKKSRS